MEKKEAKKIAPASASKCCVAETSIGHFVIKMFLALVMIGLGLVVAIVVVMSMGKGWKSACKNYAYLKAGSASSVSMTGEKFEGKVMMRDGSGMMYNLAKEDSELPVRIFGSILNIESNRITILNNASEAQVVLSEAGTIIVSSSTEVGLSALAPGQNIIVFGSNNDEEVLVAKMINIQ